MVIACGKEPKYCLKSLLTMNKKKLRKLFGERLRFLRKEQNLSQEELADKAELHHTYVGVIERGEQAATLDTIEKLAQALQVKFFDLFSFSPDPADNLKEEITASLAGKNDKTLKKILNVIRAIEK